MRTIRTVLSLSSYLIASCAFADVITYEVTNIGGNTWEYSYTVENTGTAGITDIESFSIFFDSSLTENLSVSGSPGDWDSIVLQPDLGLPDDGLFDSLALAFGIGIGESLGGFSAQFDFLGAGTPGDQFFSINDSFSFDPIFDGITSIRDVTPVPEPATLGLLAVGLFLISINTRRRHPLKQSGH